MACKDTQFYSVGKNGKEEWKAEGRMEGGRKMGRQKEDGKTEGRWEDRRKMGRQKEDGKIEWKTEGRVYEAGRGEYPIADMRPVTETKAVAEPAVQ